LAEWESGFLFPDPVALFTGLRMRLHTRAIELNRYRGIHCRHRRFEENTAEINAVISR
jgi:hypothetical protein